MSDKMAKIILTGNLQSFLIMHTQLNRNQCLKELCSLFYLKTQNNKIKMISDGTALKNN